MSTFKRIVDAARYKLGLVSADELLNQLPKKQAQERFSHDFLPDTLQPAFQDLVSTTEDLRYCRDPESLYKAMSVRVSGMQQMMKALDPHREDWVQREKVASLLGADQVVSYVPAGSRLWRFFFNPMSAFTFLGEQHWAVKAALNILRTEISEEGTKWFHHPSVTPERLAEVDRKLRELDIYKLRVDTAIRLMTYGNVYILPGFSMLNPNKLVKLINLPADKMWPQYDEHSENLIGWQYQVGASTIPYSVEEVLHLKDFSLKSRFLGAPRLGPLVTDIEADLSASALTNAIMNKAGMIGIIIALEDPSVQNPMRAKNMDREQERLQNTVQTKFSGVRGAHSVLVANYIRDVYKLTDIGSLDANFLNLRTEVARCVAILLGVPPERLSIPRTQSLAYQAASVEDMLTAVFDKNITALMKEVDEFINQKILKDLLGIYDVEIRSRGRFSSTTVNGARMAYMASMTGPLFTVNEMRSYFYKVPELPPDDPRGMQVVDNSLNRKADSTPPETSKPDPRDRIGLDPMLEEDTNRYDEGAS